MTLTSQQKLAGVIAALAVALMVISSSIYIVDPKEQAIVFQFREKKRVVQEPGLYAKIPFVQEIMYFDKRVLPLEPPGQVVILDEQKLLDVDAFGRWRISDPFLFFQSLRNETVATDRLNGLLNSAVRNVLGSAKVSDLLSGNRGAIMKQILDDMNLSAAQFGVEVVDVRIRRADLPNETIQNVYNRMRSERQKEAAALRAEGMKAANETRAKAEAQRTTILSEAQRDSQKLRGEGDKEALKILNDATSRDPQFFSFYRSLEAYRNTLRSENTTFVLSPNSEFFEYFEGKR